jgi:hypothetical protein
MSRMLALLAVTVLVIAGWTSFSDLPIAVGAPLSLRADGVAQRIGNGTVRTYVLFDPANRRVPIEVGIALSADALEGLPAPMAMKNTDAMSSHFDTHERLLALPDANPTPYQFVQFNWNPGGHEPPGIYDRPHFDFHFWTVPVDVRNSIVPSNPEFAEQAAAYPAAEYRTPFYIDAATAAKAPAAAVSVPQMGMHWLDVRSGEFNGRGFSKTYIVGSWDGRFVFDEPMITRDYIVAKRAATDPAVRDEITLVPSPEKRQVAGYYPEAYRISYDAETNEYRIALTRLTWQQ